MPAAASNERSRVSDLEALAGAVLCVGLPGPALDDATRARLAALRPGALVLFARNVTTVAATRMLVADASDAIAPALPLVVAIDQEGGRVARVAAQTPMPAMLALGATARLTPPRTRPPSRALLQQAPSRSAGPT